MSNVVYIEELILARQVVREAPEAIKALDNSLILLYNHSHLFDVAKAVYQLEDSKLMLEMILETYKLVLEQNGVKSE